MANTVLFDPDCRLCPRLASFLTGVKQQFPSYHARPVPAFGAQRPRLLIVGLAPGMHGANATGRPFTGDYAGLLLYRTLFDFGFGSQPESVAADDGLTLSDCRITNAVKCLPPQNKPNSAEINQCNGYLVNEIRALPQHAVILALGNIAHQAVVKAYRLKASNAPFGHLKTYRLPDDKTLVSSYHCSRYNVQTKRLTQAMFEQVFVIVRDILRTG